MIIHIPSRHPLIRSSQKKILDAFFVTPTIMLISFQNEIESCVHQLKHLLTVGHFSE